MVTTGRRFTRLVCCIVLALFAVNQALVLAGPRFVLDASGGCAPHATEAAFPTETPASGPFEVRARIPAEFTAGSATEPWNPPLRWLDAGASAPTKTGSWWSRRTTAQKTWFIVGLVVGAYGVYALVSHDSDGNSGGGGGGY